MVSAAKHCVANQCLIFKQIGEKTMKYTDKFDSKLIETHWLASVSHHHYWFADFRELVAFQNSRQFDLRMTISSPAN
jgi:hypothetical protein